MNDLLNDNDGCLVEEFDDDDDDFDITVEELQKEFALLSRSEPSSLSILKPNRGESSGGGIIPPPLPLLKFDSFHNRNWNSISLFDGDQIPSIHNSFADNSDDGVCHKNFRSNEANRLHNPVLCKLLVRWFICRSKREKLLKQRILAPEQLTLADTEYLASLGDQFQLQLTPVFRYSSGSNSSSFGSLGATRSDLAGDDSVTVNLIFDSNFESGNLQSASRVFSRNMLMQKEVEGLHMVPEAVSQEYDLVLRNDLFTEGNVQWFYFAVDPRAHFSLSSEPLRVRFNITNMSKAHSLYNLGMKPVVGMASTSNSPVAESSSSSPTPTIPCNSQIQWSRGGYDICYYKNYCEVADKKRAKSSSKGGEKEEKKSKRKSKSRHILSFSFTFEAPGTVYYFAHSYPFTFTDHERYLATLEQNERIRNIVHRRTLGWTLSRQRCDILTVTSPPPQQQQNVVQNMSRLESDMNINNRKSKPIVFLTSRVHPGESFASYMMQGVLDYLVSEQPLAVKLRDACVFKIVPMLNPDGVIHGNYRCSLAGLDLNRQYGSPHPYFSPIISALRSHLEELQQQDRSPILFIDFHGHSKKMNAFVYGCDPLQQFGRRKEAALSMQEDDLLNKRVYCRVFPSLLSSLSASRAGVLDSAADSPKIPYFSFPDSQFRVSKSKLGTGRVVCWEKLGVEASYTIEASFCSSGNNSQFASVRDHVDKMAAYLSENDCSRVFRGSMPYRPDISVDSGVRQYQNRFALSSRSLSCSPAKSGAYIAGSPGIAFRSLRKQEGDSITDEIKGELPQDGDPFTQHSIKMRPFPETFPTVSDNEDVLDNECRAIVDQFYSSKPVHYSKEDYHRMGIEVCLAIAQFLNIDGPQESDVDLPTVNEPNTVTTDLSDTLAEFVENFNCGDIQENRLVDDDKIGLGALRRLPTLPRNEFYRPIKSAAVYSPTDLVWASELQQPLPPRACAEISIRRSLLKGNNPEYNDYGCQQTGGQGKPLQERSYFRCSSPQYASFVNTLQINENLADQLDSDGGSDSDPSVDCGLGKRLLSQGKVSSGPMLLALLRRVCGKSGLTRRKSRRRSTPNPERDDFLKMTITARNKPPLQTRVVPDQNNISGPASSTTAAVSFSRSTQQSGTSQKLIVPTPGVPVNREAYEFRERVPSPVENFDSITDQALQDKRYSRSAARSRSSNGNIDIESLVYLSSEYVESTSSGRGGSLVNSSPVAARIVQETSRASREDAFNTTAFDNMPNAVTYKSGSIRGVNSQPSSPSAASPSAAESGRYYCEYSKQSARLFANRPSSSGRVALREDSGRPKTSSPAIPDPSTRPNRSGSSSLLTSALFEATISIQNPNNANTVKSNNVRPKSSHGNSMFALRQVAVDNRNPSKTQHQVNAESLLNTLSIRKISGSGWSNNIGTRK